MKVQRIENVSVALDYLNSVGVHLSVHPEGVHEAYTLVQHYYSVVCSP